MLVARAYGRLVYGMGSPGAHEPLDQGIRHFQWAVLPADACTHIFAEALIPIGMIECIGTFRGFESIAVGVVGTIGRVGEHRLGFRVPNLFIVFVGKTREIAVLVVLDGIVVCSDIHGLEILRGSQHVTGKSSCTLFIRSDNPDLAEQSALLIRNPPSVNIIGTIAFKSNVVGTHLLGEFGDPIHIRGTFVDIGIHRIGHNAVSAIYRQNRVLIPVVDIIVGMHPCRGGPAQYAQMNARVVQTCIGGKLEARLTRYNRIFIMCPHGRWIGPCGVVAVIAHFDLDGIHHRTSTAEQCLDQFPVHFGMIRFVIHKKT